MGYVGETLVIPCDKGGVTGHQNVDTLQPYMMVSPTRNINLNNGSREKRGGTSLVNAAPFANSPRVMGLYDFIMRSGTQYTIAATKDGKVWKDDTNTIATGLSTANHFNFETAGDELYIVDGTNMPYKWTGTGNAAAISDTPTDWNTVKPFQLIKHGKGNSERMWALTYLKVYASKDSDFDDFADADVTTLPIETTDGFGLIGGVEWQDNLLVFGKEKTFIIDDASTTVSNWGYINAAWDGGAAHWRLIIKTPNDIICMMENGEIYSVIAVQDAGDYKSASITRPSWMHKYIQDFINLTYIADFHGIYDPLLNAVKIFVVRKGQTEVDTALVFYLDRPIEEAWTIHDNQTYISGYSASCSMKKRKAAGSYGIYTGDYTGQIWEIEKATKSDNSNGYYAGFKTPPINFGNPRVNKRIDRVRMVTQPKGAYNLLGRWWIDGKWTGVGTVSLVGSGGVLDAFVLGTDILGGDEFTDTSFNLGETGKRVQIELYNSTAGQDFNISQILIDHKVLGGGP